MIVSTVFGITAMPPSTSRRYQPILCYKGTPPPKILTVIYAYENTRPAQKRPEKELRGVGRPV